MERARWGDVREGCLGTACDGRHRLVAPMIRRTLTLLAAATLAVLDVILEARRERERLDRVLAGVLADIEREERETIRPNVRGVRDVAESRYSFTVYDEATGEVRFEEYRGPAISSPGGVG